MWYEVVEGLACIVCNNSAGQNAHLVGSYTSEERTLAEAVFRNCISRAVKHYWFYRSLSCLRAE